MESYHYVGPPELRTSKLQTTRFRIGCASDIGKWAKTQTRGETLIATFVVDENGTLWIADRRSEHIACARGGRVLAAGELVFELNGQGAKVVEATNQSTGFCPHVESWVALGQALDVAELEHPSGWTSAFEFRRCQECGALNIVKDAWFVCATCDGDLPREWNIGNAQEAAGTQ